MLLHVHSVWDSPPSGSGVTFGLAHASCQGGEVSKINGRGVESGRERERLRFTKFTRGDVMVGGAGCFNLHHVDLPSMTEWLGQKTS